MPSLTPTHEQSAPVLDKELKPLSPTSPKQAPFFVYHKGLGHSAKVVRRSKRASLAHRGGLAPLKHQKHKLTGKTRTPIQINLTKMNLVHVATMQDVTSAMFDGDTRSRALQEAGKQLGFHLRLECYEQSTAIIGDWAQSLEFLFGERPIFKDHDDIVAMRKIAESFETGFRYFDDVRYEQHP